MLRVTLATIGLLLMTSAAPAGQRRISFFSGLTLHLNAAGGRPQVVRAAGGRPRVVVRGHPQRRVGVARPRKSTWQLYREEQRATPALSGARRRW